MPCLGESVIPAFLAASWKIAEAHCRVNGKSRVLGCKFFVNSFQSNNVVNCSFWVVVLPFFCGRVTRKPFFDPAGSQGESF